MESTPDFDCNSYIVSGDVLISRAPPAFYHHNPSAPMANQSYLKNVVLGQNLGPAAKSAVADGLAGRTFGGAAHLAPGSMVVSLSTDQVEDKGVKSWVLNLQKSATSLDIDLMRSGHLAWWSEFWGRSHIEVGAGLDTFIVSRQFILQRMMTAFQARSPFPIKFK